ncbi:5690_t:CDS:2, partial [Funneliformis geosporum]
PSRQSYGVIPFVVPEIFLMEIRHRTAYQLYESFGNIVATICDDQNTDKFDATEEAKFSKSVSGLHSVFRENLNESYGVLPYVAPELLQGISPTKASDIYSFGIIMWTLSAGIRPWCNRPHDLELATLICLGNRPEIFEGTPNVYSQLMKQCWHPDPLKRPTASHLYELLGNWVSAICDDPEFRSMFMIEKKSPTY